jgi:elongation factor G
MEKQRGHSLDTAIASLDHRGIHLNLHRYPGYPDFRGPALSALAAVETVLVVVDADTGVEHGTRRMMEHARARRLCRAVAINRIDPTAPTRRGCWANCARPSAPSACR